MTAAFYCLLTKIEIYIYMKCVTCHYNTYICIDWTKYWTLTRSTVCLPWCTRALYL